MDVDAPLRDMHGNSREGMVVRQKKKKKSVNRFGQQLARSAMKRNSRLWRLVNQYAELALERALKELGVTPAK